MTLAQNIGSGAKSSILPLLIILKRKNGEEVFIKGVTDEPDVGKYVELGRGQLHGRRYSYEEIKLYFNVAPGAYKLKAIYHDKNYQREENLFAQKISSGWVDIVIPWMGKRL